MLLYSCGSFVRITGARRTTSTPQLDLPHPHTQLIATPQLYHSLLYYYCSKYVVLSFSYHVIKRVQNCLQTARTTSSVFRYVELISNFYR